MKIVFLNRQYEIVTREIEKNSNQLVGMRIDQLIIDHPEELNWLLTEEGQRWSRSVCIPAFRAKTTF